MSLRKQLSQTKNKSNRNLVEILTSIGVTAMLSLPALVLLQNDSVLLTRVLAQNPTGGTTGTTPGTIAPGTGTTTAPNSTIAPGATPSPGNTQGKRMKIIEQGF